MTPTIVILAYERPDALRRLLASIESALYPPDAAVSLVISLDGSQRPQGRETLAVARSFDWQHGPKTVLEHDQHLGVVGHFRAAGALARDYGDVILLEDDLTVAPPFYDFASQVLDRYRDDERIAGTCLYGLWFNGFTLEPFTPIDDGGDVFFLGVPHTQGLCFSAAQWAAFDAWWQANRVSAHPALHPAFLRFPPDEWFPNLAAYLAQAGRYFCFPRVSLTVGWGDAGAHFDNRTTWFQAPVQLGRRDYRLPSFDAADAVYDGFFELLPDRLQRLAPALRNHDFDVDLNATKQPSNLRASHVLTSRPARAALARFGLEMTPPELNVVSGVPGTDISLARREDVLWDSGSEAKTRRLLRDYAWRRYRPSLRREVRFAATRLLASFRRVFGRS